MRKVIFSDIHANLEALQAIFDETADLEVDQYICLGDVVGYYADPEECVETIRKLNVVCIQGNHDGVASGINEPIDFNPVALEVIRWTHDQLSPESRNWLAELPLRVEIAPEIAGVHGSLRDRDEYLLSRFSVEANFELMMQEDNLKAVFFGHTHRRIIFIDDGENILVENKKVLELKENFLFMINPGGAGQPRDRTIGAPYAILEDRMVRFRIASYDLDRTARKAIELPFGELLAERLRRGV